MENSPKTRFPNSISNFHLLHNSKVFLLFFQDTSVIGPIQPLLCFLVPAIYLAANSKEQLYEQNPILYIFVFGIIGSKITNKLIVSISKLLYRLIFRRQGTPRRL